MALSQSNGALDPGIDARALLLERLTSGRLELPVMPATAAQVVAACRDENTGASKVVASLNSDPFLAAHVLRVANSAAYAPPEPVISLSHAVVRMGFTTVAQIALAVCIKGRIFRAEGYAQLITPLWPHSTVAAGWAREVARVTNRDVEGAFLLGLLHDVGRPVIIQTLVDIERETRHDFGEEQARAAMDYLHPRVGAELMRRWNMPEWMADAIAWHEDPQSAPTHREEALTASFAEQLARWTLEGDPDDATRLRDHEASVALGMESEDLECLLSARDRVRSQAEGFA